MKDLALLIKKGDLTAKQRALIYISSQIERNKTGKDVLTAKDIEALKDPKAFLTNDYIDTYNKYVKSWTYTVIIIDKVLNLYLILKLCYQRIKEIFLFGARDTLDTYLISKCLTWIDEKEKSVIEVLEELKERNNTFEEITTKNGIKEVKWVAYSNESLKEALETFRLFYSAFLAYQDILHKLDKKLEIKVSYEADETYKTIKNYVTNYDRVVDMVLINIDKTLDLHNPCRDKKIVNREEVYVDIEKIPLSEEAFNQNIEIFEELFGKRFWDGL